MRQRRGSEDRCQCMLYQDAEDATQISFHLLDVHWERSSGGSVPLRREPSAFLRAVEVGESELEGGGVREGGEVADGTGSR
jgi:hypothetical protein